MVSCILLFYLCLSVQDAPASRQDPEALYARREDLTAARAAVALWHARLQASGPPDFEAAWKIARASYWIGTHDTTRQARRAALEEGLEAARRAIRTRPDRPEGHFWLAATMGALAEAHGLRMGLRYRGEIKRELETVLKIDPAFQQGSADRALGRWYFKVPAVFGGSRTKSELHLRRSLAYDPTSHASLFFLAETLRAMGRTAEARAALEKLIASPIHEDWAPEDRDFKRQAEALLRKLPNRN